MAAPYRMNSMMAMLDAKPEVKGMESNSEQQQFWNDASNNQSPLRKHLISTYLQVPDEEAMPLLGEYFGVALSFVAFGALVRASNSSKRKYKKMIATEEERLDLRACSKCERVALESMLKESLERLGNLSLNAYQLERRVKDLVDENVARDKEKVQLLKRVADAEKLVAELRALRKAEGRANERVMSIVAAKEQDWLKEKRNLQKEIEKLKETMNGMTREAKFQARRCRNPTCEHCKGVDRVARNVKGRISLRELHSLREISQRVASPPQVNRSVEAPKVVERQQIEENRVLMKAIEHKKKQREPSKGEKFQQSGGILNESSQSASKGLLPKLKQDREFDLANILKREQKSYIGDGPSASKEASDETQLSMDNSEDKVEHPEDGNAANRNIGEEKVENAPINPGPNVHDATLEAGDRASQDESDLVELEKAFELRDDQEVSASTEDNHLVSDRPEIVENSFSEDGGTPSTATNEQQELWDEDEELLAFQESLSFGDGLVLSQVGSDANEGLEEAPGNVAAEGSTPVDQADLVEEAEIADYQGQEHTPEATGNLVHTDDGTDEVDSRFDMPEDGISPETVYTDAAEILNTSVEHANEDEQVLGVVEDQEDAVEFSDALSSPLDPVTSEMPVERDPSAAFVAELSEQDDTEYGRGMDVNENWGFDDPVSSTDGELLENQDIPVFERNNIDDDLAGELPEPDEKRVCGPPETLDCSEALTSNELSNSVKETSLQEGERLKDKDSAADIEETGTQQQDDPFVETIGLAAADAKPKSDAVVAHSQDHLEPADFVS